MHSRTSLYRFVREHVMRHAQSDRQNLAIQPGLLLDHPTGLVLRAGGRTAPVMCGQRFRGEDGAARDDARRRLRKELAAKIADALMRLRNLLAQALIANGSAFLARLLPL